MIKFKVHFNVADMEGKTVLVFLKPQAPQRNYRIHAWQELTGSAGATETFEYDDVIQTNVTSSGLQSGNVVTSNLATISPGQLFQATSPSGSSPHLAIASASQAAQKLTPQQCGVINKTAPFQQFDSNWFVNGRPVVTMPGVDANMTVSFEYLANFYFMVATPPLVGQTYIVQNFSDMTQYVAPASATGIDVNLTRDNGLWRFDFQANG